MKALREGRKWDQHRLAEAARAQGVGVTQSQISRYENGKEPNGRNALALASALGVDVRDLYESNGTPSSEDDEEAHPVRSMSLDDFLRLRIDQVLAERTDPIPSGVATR